MTRDDKVSIFVGITAVHFTKETLGQFPVVFAATKTGILSQNRSSPDTYQVVFVPKPK